MKHVLFSMIAMMAVACGSSGGGSSSAAPAVTCGAKVLSSNWIGQYYAFDLTGTKQDGSVYTGTIDHVSGAVCGGDLKMTGSDCSGTYMISSAHYVSGGGGDPGCSTLNGTFNYTKTSDNVLKLCDATSGSCLQYQ